MEHKKPGIVEVGDRSSDYHELSRPTDQVWIKCPECETQIFFVTEHGVGDGIDYSLKDAPLSVLVDLTKHAQACTGCGVILKLEIAEQPKMKVEIVGD